MNEIVGYIVLAISVNLIGYFIAFITGFHIGKGKIKALGEELRRVRKGIKDPKVVIGYNIAVSICNKYLGGKE